MRIFLSAGEPSGDIHGANLIRALRALDPAIECVGFGGDQMRAAGCRLLFPLVQLAVMWFARVLASVHKFLGFLSLADRYFRHHRPDAVVLIDFPGFNWWLARRARFHGIPVFYFVPPQLWAWAPWRVEKMRRFVDHVLCTLPFEKPWYAKRGVHAHFVGHPFFDEVPQQRLDAAFLEAQRTRPGIVIGILPGSRTQEIQKNFSTQYRAARRIHKLRPDTRFLVACFRTEHQQTIDDYLRRHPGVPIETHAGRTPEIIELSKACMAVSGSVTLELLYRAKPTTIIYRVGKFDLRLGLLFKTAKFISLVNLLADKELFPEFLTDRCEAETMSAEILRWLNDAAYYDVRVRELTELKKRVVLPGACARAAALILQALSSGKRAAA
ncbi:MAG: lipid-A-disaccharide synthase [Planctomycetes bacterium]|nr:lipid-A-disaccharide synthase [Planctomycetota bacterium]